MAKTVGKAGEREKKEPHPPILTLDDRDTTERAKAAPPPAPPVRVQTGLVVEATAAGYYDLIRRRIGDRFRLHQEKDFSHRWMRWAAKGAQPTAPSLSNQAIRQHHDEVLAGRMPSQGQPLAGIDQVEEDNPFDDK